MQQPDGEFAMLGAGTAEVSFLVGARVSESEVSGVGW